VEPAHLAAACTAIAAHPEVAFAAATTGSADLLVSLVTEDPDSCFDYITERVGPLPGVRGLRTTPILRTVKRAGAAGPRERGVAPKFAKPGEPSVSQGVGTSV
jgi:DNA-binding Lrp family transcriptional regulator